ncbi:D-lactate dehydrogenase [Escherichia coli]|uniref:D-lactate dehydrogenase n=1 Tax=Escherichia coli TaxID=562 RepID=A0A377B9A7_ECOLX|nr:D-lactate dehydrogenase [Escherichia coli]
MLAYPGTTLYSLEKALKPLGREPPLVIGSSCIGASVIGGICNNSGGSLVQRGPAYTEMSLFARINEDGKLTLVNHLGIDLGETPEQILSKLDDDRIKDDDVRHDGRHAHDYDYVHRVVILKPTRPHVITPILIGYLNLLVAPGSWRSLQYVLIPSKRKKISRCFISAPTSRKC